MHNYIITSHGHVQYAPSVTRPTPEGSPCVSVVTPYTCKWQDTDICEWHGINYPLSDILCCISEGWSRKVKKKKKNYLTTIFEVLVVCVLCLIILSVCQLTYIKSIFSSVTGDNYYKSHSFSVIFFCREKQPPIQASAVCKFIHQFE